MAKRLVVNLTMTIDIVDDLSNGEDEASNAKCPYCGWFRAYKSAESAKRGMAAHLPHCPKRSEERTRSDEIIRQWMNQLTRGDD